MRALAVEEAGAQFSALLELVEQGEEIRLMRDGEAVAELIQPRRAEEQTRAARADRALAKVRERMREEGIQPVDTATILEWVHEGRR